MSKWVNKLCTRNTCCSRCDVNVVWRPWNMTTCRLVNSYRSFGGDIEGFCFHLRGLIKSKKSEPLGRSAYLLNFSNPEEGGNKLLRNISNVITTYTASYPRRPLFNDYTFALSLRWFYAQHRMEQWKRRRNSGVISAECWWDIYSINISGCLGYTIRECLVLRRQRQTPHVSGWYVLSAFVICL